MKIAALSDFHMGSMEWADPFGHTEQDFLAILDRLEANHDHIVLLGDIFQTDHGFLPGRRTGRRLLSRIRSRYPRLSQRLLGPGYHYVGGNHDAAVWDEVGAVDALRLEDNGFAAWFVHGHQFDPMLKGITRRVSNFTTWTMGQVRALGLSFVADAAEWVDVWSKYYGFKGKRDPYTKAARRILAERNVQVVVMGHTHVPEQTTLPEGLFINTGSCNKGRLIYCSIDTDMGEADLYEEPPPA